MVSQDNLQKSSKDIVTAALKPLKVKIINSLIPTTTAGEMADVQKLEGPSFSRTELAWNVELEAFCIPTQDKSLKMKGKAFNQAAPKREEIIA